MADATFCAYVLEQLASLRGATSRAMFGGFGLYKTGIMFGIVIDNELFLKVDADNQPDYEARGCKPFMYEARGKTVSMSYWRVPDDVLEDADVLKEWAAKALTAAITARRAKPAVPRRTRERARPRR